MDIAKKTVHIAPVGFHPEKIVESIRQFPVHKVIMIIHPGDENKPSVMNAVNSIDNAFGDIDIEKVSVERENIIKASLDLIDIASREIKNGNQVMFNISGGLRNISMAAYFVGMVSGIDTYTDIPQSNEEKYSLKGILSIPYLPIAQLRKEQLRILDHLEDDADSQDELIYRLNPDIGQEDLGKERSRLTHHLKHLRDIDLVETIKMGKKSVVKRTAMGTLYCKGNRLKTLIDNS